MLGWSGRSELERLVGAGLVALGPLFLAVTTLQGQVDCMSAFAVLAAIAVWMRADAERRWLYAGLLLGVGAAIKTTPIFALLALIPTAVGNRERFKLAAVSVAIPAISVLPFAAAYPQTIHDIVSYHGSPGAGGINLLFQPRLALDWYTDIKVIPTATVDHLSRVGGDLALVAALVAAAYAWRRKLDPLTSAVLVYGAVLVFGVNFFLQYAVWLLPLVIAWGRLRIAATATAVLCVPLAFRYAWSAHLRSTPIWSATAVVHGYAPAMALLLIGTFAGLAMIVWRIETERSGAVVSAARAAPAARAFGLMAGVATAVVAVAAVGALVGTNTGAASPQTVAVGVPSGPGRVLGPSTGPAPVGSTSPHASTPATPANTLVPATSGPRTSGPASTHPTHLPSAPSGPKHGSGPEQTCNGDCGPGGGRAAAPTISHLRPAVGPVTGGTRVLIFGTGYSRDAAVRFGSQSLTVTRLSSTELAVTAPAATLAQLDRAAAADLHGLVVQIVVTTSAGHSAVGPLSAFTYL